MMTCDSVAASAVLSCIGRKLKPKRDIREQSTRMRFMADWTVDKALYLLKKMGRIESPKQGHYRLKRERMQRND